MQEKLLPILILFGIAYAGIGTWKKTRALKKLHRDLPEDGKLELEKIYPLLKHNGRRIAAISWLSGLIGVSLFLWVLLTKVIAL
jgi:hypothetical protein